MFYTFSRNLANYRADTRCLDFRTYLSNGAGSNDWQGADDIAVERALRAIFRFEMGVSKLDSLGLFVNQWMPLEGAKRIMAVFSSDFASQLTSLTLNHLGYPEIDHLLNLKRLTLDYRGVASLYISPGGADTPSRFLGHLHDMPRCHFPIAGALEELRIFADEIGYERVQLTRVLPTLHVFELHGPLDAVFCDSGTDVKRFDAVMPNLTNFRWQFWHSVFYGAHREIALPKSLTSLNICVHGLRALPPLTHLKSLTQLQILHHLLPPAWDLQIHVPGGFSLDPIFHLPALTKLNIIQRSADANQQKLFFDKIASPGVLPNLLEFSMTGNILPGPELAKARPELMLDLTVRTKPSKYPIEIDYGAWSPIPTDPLLSAPSEEDRQTCTYCKQLISKTYLSDHVEMCLMATKKCPLGCHYECVRTNLGAHLANCPNYAMSCVVCGRIVARSSFHEHVALHNDLESNTSLPLLVRPAFKVSTFRKVLTKCCEQHFADADEAMKHSCPTQTKHKVKLSFSARQAARWERSLFPSDHEAHTNGFLHIDPLASRPM